MSNSDFPKHDFPEQVIDKNILLFDYRNYDTLSDQFINFLNNGRPYIFDRGNLTYVKDNLNGCVNYCNSMSDCTGLLVDSPHPDSDDNYDCFLKSDFDIKPYNNSNAIIYAKPILYIKINEADQLNLINSTNSNDKKIINKTKSFYSINDALYDCNNSDDCVGFISNDYSNSFYVKHQIF